MQQAIQELAQHHSNSVLVSQARRRLLVITMAQREPWVCAQCNIKVKASANYCGQCGQGWTYASAAPAATPWKQWGPNRWSGQDSPRGRPSWEEGKGGKQQPGPKGKSPRRRPQGKGDWSPRRRPNKGQQQETGKGAPQPAANKGKGAGAVTAPTVAALPTAPVPAAISQPSVPAGATGSASPEATLLQTVLGAMAQSREELPPALRDLLDAQASEKFRNNKKAMHKLVATQSTARLELEQVRSARRDFLGQWSAYTGALCSMWEKQLQEKQTALQQFDEAEQQWMGQLHDATKDLAKMTTEGLVDVQNVGSSSEDDMETSELIVDEELQRAKQRKDLQEQVSASEAQITQTLQAARQAALEQANIYAARDERERSPRRRRISKEAESSKASEKPGSNWTTIWLAPWQGLVTSLTGLTRPIHVPDHSRHTVVQEDDYVPPWMARFLGLRATYEAELADYGFSTTRRLDPRERDFTPLRFSFKDYACCRYSENRLAQIAGHYTIPPMFQFAVCHMDSRTTARADAMGGSVLTSGSERVDSLACESSQGSVQSEVHCTDTCTNVVPRKPVPRTVTFDLRVQVQRFVPGARLSHNWGQQRVPSPWTCTASILRDKGRADQVFAQVKAGQQRYASEVRSLSVASAQCVPSPWTCTTDILCDKGTAVEASDKVRFGQTSCPAYPALQHNKAAPGMISDLQAMIASHVPLRPGWVQGPLLHMSPFEARWLAQHFPEGAEQERFTVFDCRLDLMSRGANRDWSLLDYVTAAIRSVPYRVRLVWYIVHPIPDLPVPQFALTGQDAPPDARALPVGGLLHTVEVGPGSLQQLWSQLRNKGVDPAGRLEQAWQEGLCFFADEEGRQVQHIDFAALSPEWIELRAQDPGHREPIHVDYLGGPGAVLRVPRPPDLRADARGTTSTTTAVAVQPVALHGQALMPDEVAILPVDLLGPAERTLPLGSVQGLRYLLQELGATQGHYTLFERAGNMHVRALRGGWTFTDLVLDVMSVVPMLRCIQILHSPLPRLPLLQVAATELGWPLESLAVPFDLRGAGAQICTLVVGPGLSQRVLHEAVWTECTASRRSIPDTVQFVDSLGRSDDTRPPMVDAQFFVPAFPMAWVSAPLAAGVPASEGDSPVSPFSATSTPGGTASTTTTTTTWAMQWAGVRFTQQGVDRTAEHLLAHHNQLVVFTAHSVEYGPLCPSGSSLAEALAPLLAQVLQRGHGPRMGFLQCTRALPLVESATWMVPIIWAERTGTHVHVIFDARCGQGGIQMLTLPRGTTAEQVMPFALQQQGWTLSVNGVAAPCLRRSLETGDILFLSKPNKPVPGFHFGHAVLLMPHLRVLTLPISLVDARSVPQQLTPVQTRDNVDIMRDELVRHINARIHLMGHAGPGLYPVTVMSMHHGPVFLYIPGPNPLLEHVQMVLDSIPEMPSGLRAYESDVFLGDTSVFVTADPEAGTSTALVASTLGQGLDNLIPVALLPTQHQLGTAVYLAPGFIAEPFPTHRNGLYIRRTRVALPGSGTSLASISASNEARKLRRVCDQAKSKGIHSPRCDIAQAAPFARPGTDTGQLRSIPTPFGRRSLPVPRAAASAPTHSSDAVDHSFAKKSPERHVLVLADAVPEPVAAPPLAPGPSLCLGVTPEMFEAVFEDYGIGLFERQLPTGRRATSCWAIPPHTASNELGDF